MAQSRQATSWRSNTEPTVLSALRRGLQIECDRLALDLRRCHDLLLQIKNLNPRAALDDLLVAYKALMLIIAREDFRTMAPERLPVVISQVMMRLRRLDQLLRKAQSRTPLPAALIVH